MLKPTFSRLSDELPFDPPLPQPRWKISWLLLAIVAVGTYLRLSQAGESLWVDELHTSWTVSGSWSDVAPRAMAGNQSPVYFWAEWLVVRLYGPNEWSLRALSLVAGCLLPAAVYRLTRQLLTPTDFPTDRATDEAHHLAALLAAWITATTQLNLFFAQEARPYAWVQLIGVLQLSAFLAWLRRPDLGRTSLQQAYFAAGLALLLVNLQYTAALLLVAEAAIVLGYVVWGEARPWKVWLLPVMICGALLLPHLTNLQAILAHRDDWKAFIAIPTTGDFWNLLPGTLFALYPVLFTFSQLLRGRSGERKRLAYQTAGEVLPVALWLYVPLLVAFFCTRGNLAPVWHVRYLVVALPAVAILLGMIVPLVPLRLFRWLACAVIAFAWVWRSGLVEQWQTDGRFHSERHEEWRKTIALLAKKQTGDGSPVLVYSGLIETDRLKLPISTALDHNYGLLPIQGLYHLPGFAEVFTPLPYSSPWKLPPSTTKQIATKRQAWLLIRGGEKHALAIAQAVQLQVQSQAGGKFSTQLLATKVSATDRVQLIQVRVIPQKSKPQPLGPLEPGSKSAK